MKLSKRILSLLLALVLAGLCSVPAFAAKAWSQAIPTILIHGILQSEVYLHNGDGSLALNDDGAAIPNFPPPIDVAKLVLQLAPPLLASLALQRDICLSKTVRSAIADTFIYTRNGQDGMPAYPFEVVRYPSLAKCSEAEKAAVYNMLPIQPLAEEIGEENVYLFTFNSFGNLETITKELYDFIESVKKERSCAKVNLVPISQGATFFNHLIEYYPEVSKSLNNVVLVVGALDGSAIVGDIYTDTVAFSDDELLYRDMFPSLLGGGYLGGIINLALRLFPKRVLQGLLDSVVQGLVGDTLSYCTTLWALVPGEDYDTAAALWLSDGKHDEIRRQTDRYRQAQKNSRENIKALQSKGVRVYAIAEYDFALYAVAKDYKTLNADGVIHLDSTSLGAVSGSVGTPLPADYKQAAHPGCEHISPDGIVDASAGALPDHTFYFKGQSHESTGSNDALLALVCRLAASKDYETVFSMPQWPQFNHARNTKQLQLDLAEAKALDPSKLSAEDAAGLAAAIAQAEAMLNTTIVVPTETDAAIAALSAVMIKLGLREPERTDYAAIILDPIFKYINEKLYCRKGARGFSDPFWVKWK